MKQLIKVALENVVLCRGGHNAKESYEYAKKMERLIIENLIKNLKEASLSPTGINDLIAELESAQSLDF